MRSYGQYCPVAKAAEIIGDRWTLMVIRELLFGPVGFNELARACPASRGRSWPNASGTSSVSASPSTSARTASGRAATG
jgi:HxlR-like helix-turn-helix